MKIILGLGNIGQKYENTRHNAGFLFVNELRNFLGNDTLHDVKDWKYDEKYLSEICEAKSGESSRIILAKPSTLMNRSGLAALRLVSYFNIDADKDFILVHDDLDLELGKFKIQRSVAPKKHNGVNDVELKLLKKEFFRVRLGVDSRLGDRTIPGDAYVLSKFSEEELAVLHKVIGEAIKSLREIVEF
ncbi:aminoacyl-tRNA hydrolase [Candidatus Dojkabacteria bacterium]|nr:aminoacyl-tRNA hydrolase [Candidatus Dojkabacteria bacterium]